MLKSPDVRPAQRGVIAVLLLLVLWCGWQSKMSSQPTILPLSDRPHQQTAATTTASENPADKVDWHNWLRDPITVFTSLLTIFNGLLFASTIGLWVASRKTAQISERALVDLERPYIFFHKIQTDIGAFTTLMPQPSTVPYFDFSVINYGRTPGSIELAIVKFDLLDKIPEEPKTENVEVDNSTYIAAVVIVGQNSEYIFRRLALESINYTREMRDKWNTDRTLDLYCWGMLEYRDIFDKTHTTTFCRRYDFKHREWIPVGERHRNQSN
jgi:hypothetical protein